MRRAALITVSMLTFAACGGSADDEAGDADEPTATEPAAATAPPAPSDTTGAPTEPAAVTTAPSAGDDPVVPGPGDAVGTLTGPDLDIVVVGQCDFDTSDLTSADIAFADVRGVDPDGVEWPARFGLSGSDTRNTQVNINGTQVVVRWPEPGLLEQSTDEGSYLLDDVIGRLVVTTAEGYELNISCFER
ncbi:MAG: hypothetical protein MUE78_01835 [Ilumatobacteraceae bacterium]|jgi:hypothetical protein|nr:hypothetical protein [Ilumatobacteraceae bacterium]